MRRFLPAVALLAAGCAVAPQPTGPQALVSADAAGSARCGPDGDPICEARVIRVDGKRVFSRDAVAVEPGRRRLTVYCRYNVSIMIGDAHSVEREVVAELAAGRRYRVEARMRPEPCSIAIAEER